MYLTKEEAGKWAKVLNAFAEGKKMEVYKETYNSKSGIETLQWCPLNDDFICISGNDKDTFEPEDYRWEE